MISKCISADSLKKPKDYQYAVSGKCVPVGSIVIDRDVQRTQLEQIFQSETYISNLYENYSFADDHEWFTIREIVTIKCLDISASDISDVSIVALLKKEYTPGDLGVYKLSPNSEKRIFTRSYDQPTHVMYDPTQLENDDHELIVTARAVGHILYLHQDKSHILQYQEICKLLETKTYKNQEIILKALKPIVGDIKVLASQMSVRNLEYVMSKLKLTTSLPLIYTFATSPSVMGKITALWQFLEIHELIWLQTPWGGIEAVISTFYRIFEWICEKTSLIGDLAKEGIEWVSAKIDKLPEDRDMNVKSDIGIHYDPKAVDEVDIIEEEAFHQVLPSTSKGAICKYCMFRADYHCANCKWTVCETHYLTDICSCDIQHLHHNNEECGCDTTQDLTSEVESDSDSYSSMSSYLDRMMEVARTLKEDEEMTNEKIIQKTKQINDKMETKTACSFANLLSSLKLEEFGAKISTWFEDVFRSILLWTDTNPILLGMLSLSAAIATALGFTLPQFSSDFEIKGFLNKISNGLRTTYYANKGTESLFSAFTGVMTSVKETLGISKDQGVIEFKKEVAEMYELAQRMLREANLEPGKFINNAQNFGEFKQKMKGMTDLYHKLSHQEGHHSLAVIMPIWHSLNKTLMDLNLVYDKLLASCSERPVPVFFWIWGKTDVGKSTFLSYYTDELNRRLQTQMETFTLCTGPEYWNNFAQQDIIKIDDFGAWTGPEGSTDALSVFNLITNSPYNPSMAALQDKNIMATPKFVIAASNYPTVPINSSVTNIEAFERRRHVFIHAEWPDHEKNCQPGERNCEHWKRVRERNKDEITDFSHLKFTLCNPMVTLPSGQTSRSVNESSGRGKVISTGMELAPEKIVADGREVTFEQIMQLSIDYYNNHRKTFEAAMARKQKSMTPVRHATVDYWANPPVIAFCGPPGTGKSYCAEASLKKKFGNDWQKHVHVLKGIDQLRAFANSNFKIGKNKTYVYIDDTTPLTNDNELFLQYYDKIADKYDQRQETSTWLICVNMEIFLDKVLELKGYEGQSYVFRRCQLVHFSFRTYKTFKSLGLRKYEYTVEDIKKAINDKKDDFIMDEYVDRTIEEDSYSFDQLRGWISDYESAITDTFMMDELPVYNKFNPDSTVRIKMSANEFRVMCNNKSPVSIASELITGRIYVKGKISFKELAYKLMNTVKRAANVCSTVRDLDMMLVEAWNRGHFSTFRDMRLMISFDDSTYVVDGSDPDNVMVGKFQHPGDVLDGLMPSLSSCCETIRKSDIVSIGTDLLPSWVVLAGDIIMSIAKVSATALLSASALQSERKKNRALEVYSKTENIVSEYTNSKLDDVPTVLETTLYPKNVTSVKEPRHASLDDEDILGQSHSNPENFKPVPRRQDTDPDKVKPINARGGRKQKAPHRRERVNPDLPAVPEMENTVPIPEKEILDLTVKPNTELDITYTRQVATDPEVPAIISAIVPNCVTILGGDGRRLCYGLMIKGRIGTTVAHIREATGDIKYLKVKTATGQVYVARVGEIVERIDRLDFEITDKQCPEFRDITAHLNSKEGKINYKSEGTLITLTHDINLANPIVKLRSYRIEGMKAVVFNGDKNSFYHIQYVGHKVGVAMVGIQTYAGDCGSILVINDPNWKWGKIVGMHVGACSQTGYARLMHKEHYTQQEVLTSIEPEKQIYKPPIFLDPKYVHPSINDSGAVGVTHDKMYVPEKTKLYRNLEPIGPREYEPAVLGHKDPRKPGANVLCEEAARWRINRHEFSAKDRTRFIEIRDQMADYYVSILAREGTKLSTLTRQEACNKLRGVSKSEPINIKTSPGFPYSSITRQHGKRDFLLVDQNGIHRFNKMHPNYPELKRGMDAYSNELHGRGVAPCIFKICLKDEPLKVGKQTRTIAAAPLDFQVVYRQYLHSAQANVAENWHQLPGKIGINPISLDWNALFHTLASNSLTGLDVDFTGWDFSPHPFLVSLLPGFWNRIYQQLDEKWTEEDDRMRDILYSKVNCFQMLVGCSVYEATGGIPSGYPGTSPDNTIINDIVNCAIYIKLMEKIAPSCAFVWSWYEDVVSATYGDDRLMTVSPWLHDKLDLKFYKEQLEEWGFKATGADKSSELKYKPLMECQFLSRGFKQFHNFVVGPLNKSRMYKTTWWVHDNPAYFYNPKAEIYAKNVDNIFNSYLCVLQEAAIHGEVEYGLVMQACKKVDKKVHMPDRWPTYREMIARIFQIHLHPNPSFDVEFYDENEWLAENPILPISIPKSAVFMKSRTSYGYGPAYSYNGAEHPEAPIPAKLQKLLDYVNTKYDKEWNSVLINRYHKFGSIGWHKDDESAVDQSASVGCITLRGDGVVRFRIKGSSETTHQVATGTMYIMGPQNLEMYEHCRTDHYAEMTISVTFRKLGILSLERRAHQNDVPTSKPDFDNC